MAQERNSCSSILFQNEINSKTIFLELTRKSYYQTRMPSKKRVPELIRYLVGVQISRLHFAKYVGYLLELGSAPCATTAQWKHNFYVTLGKSASLDVTFGKKVHQWCISPESLAEFLQRHVRKTIYFMPT